MTIRAVVTDIEGTTSSLSFVKDVLFPYARNQLPAFVARHGEEPAVKALLADAAREAAIDARPAEVVALLLRWIDEDRKATPLKALQGLIWEHGYAAGDFTGHIYEDAARNLRNWHEAGVALYVYSSGSVLAQKLLFAHTAYGDLTPLFSGYFDTRIGAKAEAASYQAIADSVQLPPETMLFLSDISAELAAAHSVGMQVIQLVRDTQVEPGPYPGVVDFDGIDLSAMRN